MVNFFLVIGFISLVTIIISVVMTAIKFAMLQIMDDEEHATLTIGCLMIVLWAIGIVMGIIGLIGWGMGY